jgi:hypothetical protein
MSHPLPDPQPPEPSSAATQRRLAFARAFCRLGQAAAAYREVFPASRSWRPDSVAHAGGKLLRDPIVVREIALINEDARLDAIGSRQEIAKLLVDIMRGTTTETRIVCGPDGSRTPVEIPPPISQRIRAARELHRMLPEVEPPKPESTARDDASSTLDDRLAALQKSRTQRKENTCQPSNSPSPSAPAAPRPTARAKTPTPSSRSSASAASSSAAAASTPRY